MHWYQIYLSGMPWLMTVWHCSNESLFTEWITVPAHATHRWPTGIFHKIRRCYFFGSFEYSVSRLTILYLIHEKWNVIHRKTRFSVYICLQIYFYEFVCINNFVCTQELRYHIKINRVVVEISAYLTVNGTKPCSSHKRNNNITIVVIYLSNTCNNVLELRRLFLK